jgi:phosphatidylglycerophosphate synthase
MRSIIPNLLSLSRIPLSIICLALYSKEDYLAYKVAISGVFIALITDFLDGYLARRFGTSSEGGYIIDGIGDRAIYVSLILVILVQHGLPILVAWLLIFREISVYAARLFSRDWLVLSRGIRFLSRLHAGGLRIWLLTYLVADGIRFKLGIDLYDYTVLNTIQSALASGVLVVSYYSLYRQAAVAFKACDRQ